MSAEAEVALRLIEAFNRGEDPLELGLATEDFEYVSPPDAMEPGVRKGAEGWRRVAESLSDTYEKMTVDVERTLDAGDGRVVILATLDVRGRGSGMALRQEAGYIYTVRDGKVHRIEWFMTQAGALEAAGLDPGQAATGSG